MKLQYPLNKKYFKHYLFVLTLSVLPQAVFSSTLETATTGVNTGAYMMQTLLGLGGVIALIFAIGWVVKKIGYGGVMHNKHMRVVSSMPLGTREKLLLVEVGGKQMMVGVTAQQINLLHQLEDPVEDPKMQQEVSEFGKKIREILKKGVV